MKTKFGLYFGFILIGLAVLLILSSLQIIPETVSSIIISWQTLLLVIGIKLLLMRMYIPGAVLTVVALYFEIPMVYAKLGIDFPLEGKSLLTILIAVLLIIAGFFSIRMSRYISSHEKGFINIKPNSKGLVKISCAFGENSHTILEKPFKGAQVSTAFGTSNINLERSNLAEGDTFLEINNAFVETRILVPDNWNVESSMQSILGEFKDRRIERNASAGKRLIINGANILGEIILDSITTGNASDVEEEESDSSKEDEIIDSITVKQNNKVHIIALDELFYIQADGDYVTLCTAKGNFLKEQTMKALQKALPQDRFARIHRSFIVNIAEIASIDSQGKETYYVILKNGTSLRVSASGYQELKQKLDI